MNLRNNLIILAAIFLVGWIIVTPVNRIGKINLNSYDRAPAADQTITPKEMKSFLMVWSQFLQKDLSRRGIQQLSLASGKPSEVLPAPLLRWLKGEGWNADRFFFVEQRLRAIVKTVVLKRNLEANQKMLSTVSGMDQENMRRIIAEQERQINAEKVTSEELKLVSDSLYQVNAILEGKAVYQPD